MTLPWIPRLSPIALIVVFCAGCQPSPPGTLTYNERFRPQFHFSPEINWMNDPNGLVYHRGEYHLFYQYNPFGIKWGHMSWGHAVSPDLVHWESLPVALSEEDGVMIFSGSAVVDTNNDTGFGTSTDPAMVAVYTGHTDQNQSQHIAYSTDNGRSWTKFADNPVLDIGMKDFRDPKIFWHTESQKWIMVIALSVERKLHFYASDDLKAWSFLSEFGPAGSTSGIWECPDLFELPLAGEAGASRWVLIVNVGSDAAAGGSGGQYFVGDFDGERFVNANPDSLTLWLDYGADFYAGVTWNNLPETDGRRVLIGWMNNWQYAQDIPTDPWRSAQSLPRSLGLRQTRDGIRLVQLPVEELGSLATPVHNLQHFPVEGRIRIEETIPELFRLDAELDLAGASRAGFVLHYGDDNETLVGYDAEKQELFIDRRASGMTAFHEAFPGIHAAPLAVDDGILSLHLFADRSSIEVFAEDGLVALTDRIFPEGPFNGLSIWSEGGSIEARRLDINAMASIWQ